MRIAAPQTYPFVILSSLLLFAMPRLAGGQELPTSQPTSETAQEQTVATTSSPYLLSEAALVALRANDWGAVGLLATVELAQALAADTFDPHEAFDLRHYAWTDVNREQGSQLELRWGPEEHGLRTVWAHMSDLNRLHTAVLVILEAEGGWTVAGVSILDMDAWLAGDYVEGL